MLIRQALVISALVAAGTASAATMDINLSSDAAQFKFATLVGGSTYGRTELSAGFLYNENENTMTEVGLHVIDTAGSKTPGLTLGVGPKLYFATTEPGDALSIGLGGRLQYKFPNMKRMLAAGSLYYAPSITSFQDAKSLTEVGVALEYEVLPTANAYLGYRNIRVSLDNNRGSETIDRSVMAGLRFNF